jgi:coenzyme F420 hydrogenase subunit beta
MPKILSPVLERVSRGELCAGCGLCAGISDGAIRMDVVAPGFNRPTTTKAVTPEIDAIIDDCCPGSTVAPWAEAPNTHFAWGPWRSIGTGYSTDPDLRYSASSGGMISALALQAMDAGLVDAVVQVGRHSDDPIRNAVYVSNDTDGVRKWVGSRYGPSSPLADIGTLLADTRRFAFVGKPCDVSALRQLAKHDARVNARFPIMLSFFCAGIPSHTGTEEILEDLGVAKTDLADFKYRGDGWPGYATATRKDGSLERMSYFDSWGHRLSKRVQYRCKICPDAVGGVADVACGDAWYGDDRGYPLFDEADGRSLVIARTEAGVALMGAAQARGAVVVDPLEIAEVSKMQQSQEQRKTLVLARLVAAALLFQPRYRAKGLSIGTAARQAGIRISVKNVLGSIRRIVLGMR